MWCASGRSVVVNPVAKTIVSSSCSTPAPSTMPVLVTRSMPVVTTSTLGWSSAG